MKQRAQSSKSVPGGQPHAICGAKCRNGKPCTQKPMANGRCKMHGGKSPVGIESPNFVHGRYSKAMPARLASRFEEALADKELISLRRQIALQDALWQEHLAKLSESSSAELWQAASDRFAELRAAMKAGKADEVVVALSALDSILSNGLGQQNAERSIRAIFLEMVQTCKAEAAREAALEQNITAREANVLLASVLESINRNVTDPVAKSRIAQDLIRLSDSPAGAGAASRN